MKKLLVASILLGPIFSCNNAGNSNVESIKKQDSAIKGEPIHSADSRKINLIADTGIKKSDTLNNYKKDILGIWQLEGMDNPTFVIGSNSIKYPENFRSYKYKIDKDSIRINYIDYSASFQIYLKGADTLILTGDEKQVYYRVKR